MVYKIGILTTHPIQYQVPWFRKLSALPEIDLTVFYCMIPNEMQQGDGFGINFTWDIPLLDGYKYEVLENVSKQPSVINYWGCDTPGIKDIVKNREFDAFVVNGWIVKSCIQLLRVCRQYDVPCIVRGESNAIRPRAWWKGQIHKRLLAKYSAFLNIGKSNREFYLQNGIADEKIFFAPYCVDNERFELAYEALSQERDSIRERWGITSTAFTFLFCAKFIEKKYPMHLLNSMCIAIKKIEDLSIRIHLLMVGDGKQKIECEEFVRQRKLPVTFTGFLNQTEIVQAYVASDCLVLPSDYGETWGLVVNEAMACGLPVIVSDHVGCHKDLVYSGQTGDIFPFGDHNALAELLVLFSSNPANVRSMGKRAKQKVADYSVENVVKGCIEAIKFFCKN